MRSDRLPDDAQSPWAVRPHANFVMEGSHSARSVLCYCLPMMICARCEALKRAFDLFSREHENALGWLREVFHTTEADLHIRMRHLTERSRLEYEAARTDLEQHRLTHVAFESAE